MIAFGNPMYKPDESSFLNFLYFPSRYFTFFKMTGACDLTETTWADPPPGPDPNFTTPFSPVQFSKLADQQRDWPK